MKCQICNSSNLVLILDLGKHPPPLKFLEQKMTRKDLFDLQLYFCETCKLTQLGNAVDPNLMFIDYLYTSGVSTAFRNHLYEFANLLIEKFTLTSRDLVIDIASNDGTLLSGFSKGNVKVLGVEPSNTAKIAIKNGIDTVNDFFNEDVAKKIFTEYGSAKIITATNVFAHIDKLDSLMRGIKLLLSDDGAFVSESQYLLDIVEKLEYDTIYHEHLRYYALHNLIELFNRYEMDVFDAERIPAQGGSIRVYACKKGKNPISESVNSIIKLENDKNLLSMETLKEFATRIKDNKKKLNEILLNLKSQGKKVVGISAPARSCTILNYCGIGPHILDYIAEKSDLKIGKFTPGSNIEVVDDKKLVEDQPEYALLLSWHLKDSIVPKLRKDGFQGKFIVPLPIPKIL